jgi:shikimate dehydrogenase
MLGLSIDYGRIDATAPDAVALARRLRTEPDWLGLSVTMPMKQPMLEIIKNK